MNVAGTPIRLKSLVTALSFAAVTIVGTIYGAGLKMSAQTEQSLSKQREADYAERITQLEGARARLEMARGDLLKKIEIVKERREARALRTPES